MGEEVTDKHVIKRMFAFIVEGEDGEGVCAFKTAEGWMPMVASDIKRVSSLIPYAQGIANDTGKIVKLCEFSCRTEIQEILKDE